MFRPKKVPAVVILGRTDVYDRPFLFVLDYKPLLGCTWQRTSLGNMSLITNFQPVFKSWLKRTYLAVLNVILCNPKLSHVSISKALEKWICTFFVRPTNQKTDLSSHVMIWTDFLMKANEKTKNSPWPIMWYIIPFWKFWQITSIEFA